MYIVDKKSNSISEIKYKTFHDLGFKERANLQEWIAKNPSCLGEELLIIQKEFDGFNDTNERLDLLALDKKGALVIIENKLDDTGKDVTWQTLKYVSYCATLNVNQIIEIYQQYLDKYEKGEEAKSKLVNFFDGKPIDEISLNDCDQRIILVAGKFRKEVTSTAMWMINHGILVQCIKATAFQHNEDIFLDIEQIIPVKEAEDYMIKMADKAKETQSIQASNSKLEILRKDYWSTLLDSYNKKSKEFQNISPSKDQWISCGSGVSGVTFSLVASTSYADVEVTINKGGNKRENEEIFNKLLEQKDEIEKEFGNKLLWDRLEAKISCRISYRLEGVNVRNREDWNKMISFQCDEMPKFYNAIHDKIIKVAK